MAHASSISCMVVVTGLDPHGKLRAVIDIVLAIPQELELPT